MYDALTFLADVDGLPDTPCCSVRLRADDCSLIPVDDVILCVDMICDRTFVLLEA